MTTRASGTYAVAWAQTRIDGCADAPFDALSLGASFSWSGRPVRLDGPQDVLVLNRAAGAEDLSHRAGRRACRFPGASRRRAERTGGILPLKGGFLVTDGRGSWPVTLVRDRLAPRPLVAFPEGLPPMDAGLWIVEIAEALRGPEEPAPQGVICFAAGTRLSTPRGPCTVESLRPGDRLLTRDNGAQRVLWTGSTRLGPARLQLIPDLRPIRIRAAALGTDLPDDTLVVSPNHRVLLRGPSARALFGTDEVLVAAGDMVNDASILRLCPPRGLTYHHVLLERHEVVWANSLPTETFHPDAAALDLIDPLQRSRLLRRLPDPARYGPSARRLLSRAEAAILQHDSRAVLRH